MPRILFSLLLAAGLALTGCADEAFTDVASSTPATPSASASKTCSVTVSGDTDVRPGDISTYTYSTSGCGTISNVIWQVTGDGSITSQNSTSAQVQADNLSNPPGSYTVKANVVYNVDEIATGTLVVNVDPESIWVGLSNATLGLYVSTSGMPTDADICEVTREVRNYSTGTLISSTSWTVSGCSFPYQDYYYYVTKGGSLSLTYTVDAYDSDDHYVGTGTVTRRGEEV